MPNLSIRSIINFLLILILIGGYGCTEIERSIPVMPPPPEFDAKVYVTGSVGTLERLTIGGPDEFVSNISPDSRWLLMDVTDSAKNKIIYKYDLVNQSKVIMTPKSSKSIEGEWLPDMSGIIFSSNRSGNYILVQSLDIVGGVGVRYITTPSLGNARFPDVSTDGKDVAFSMLNSKRDNQLAIIGISGTNLRIFGSGWSPQFSPDDKYLCFTRFAGKIHVYTMDKMGTNVTQITSGDYNDYGPSWSPNGKQIVFTSDRMGNRRHLFVMDSNGLNVTQLTDGNFNIANSKWGKDGYIYFSSNAGNNWDVWRLKLKR